MAEAVLHVELVPTTSGIKRGIEKEVNGSFDTVEKKGSSVFGKIGGLAKGAALAAAGAAASLTGIAVKGGFERMLKIEDAQAKLDGLGHSVETVDTIMSSALASVKGTAYGLDTAATVAASAVAAGIKPGEELEKYLRLTADAATIAGISMDEMGSIMNKVQANGRAMTENLNQLQDRGIPILQWLAEEYGVTTEAMSEMVSQGEVDAETFNRVLQENIGGAALKSGETTRGAWANMLAALSRVGVALLENVFPYFKTTFNNITELLDGLTDRIGPFAEAFGGKFAAIAESIGSAFSGVGDTLGPLMERFAPLADLAGYFTPLGAVFKLIVPLLPKLLEPLAAIGDTLAEFAVSYLPIVAELFGTLGQTLAAAMLVAIPLVTDLLGLFSTLMAGLLPALIPMFQTFAGVITQLATALLPVVSMLVQSLMPVFEALIPLVIGIVSALLPLVSTLVTALAPILVIVAELIGTVLAPILGALTEIIVMLTPVIQALVEKAVAALSTALAFLAPVIEGVVNAIGAILVPVLDLLMAALTGVIDFIVNVFQGDWEGAWNAVTELFGNIWNGLIEVVRGVVNGLIDVINGVIEGLNGISVEIPDWVPIFGGETFGLDIPTIPQLEDGALVKARQGGTLANIGEGRYDEMVVPLSPDVLGQLNQGGGGTVNVYPQPGMSEMEIGRAAAKERAQMARGW